jgi:PTS system N-acetylglucosamine-specific IIC component
MNPKNLKEKAYKILEAVRGKENVEEVEACITRIRFVLKSCNDIDEKNLKENGSLGIIKINKNEIHIVIGPAADPIVTYIKKLL